MPQEYLVKDTSLTAIADAIRTKTGVTDALTLDEMVVQIGEFQVGGVELPELSNEGSASDLLSGTELIDSEGNKVMGTIPTKTSSDLTASGATVTVPAGYYATQATKSVATATQATPSVSINSSGLITASATQTAGYVSAGTKSGTKQLTTQAAKTVTPTKSSQTAVASGVYTTGAVMVGAIPAEYITTTDATASADEIMSGETAYVNGSKVTGSFTIDSELTTQDSLITQIQTALQSKAAGTGTEDLDAELTTQESLISQLGTILDSKASGGSGGGGSVETCTVELEIELSLGVEYDDGYFVVCYTNAQNEIATVLADDWTIESSLWGGMAYLTLTAAKNTMLYAHFQPANVYGAAEPLDPDTWGASMVFIIRNDCRLYV